MKKSKKNMIIKIFSIGILFFLIVSLPACDITRACNTSFWGNPEEEKDFSFLEDYVYWFVEPFELLLDRLGVLEAERREEERREQTRRRREEIREQERRLREEIREQERRLREEEERREQTRETETTETAMVEIDIEWEDFYFPACVVPPELYEAYYAYEGEYEGGILGVKHGPGINEDSPLDYYHTASFVFSNFWYKEVIVWYLNNDENRSEWLKSEPIAPHETVIIEHGYYHDSYSDCPYLGEESSFRRGISHILVIDSDETCAFIDPKSEDVKDFLTEIPNPAYDLFVD